MGLASCASKARAFSKATTMIRKPPGGFSLKMASTARAISCNMIPHPESTALSNVRGGREEKHTMGAGQQTLNNRQWTCSCLAPSETRRLFSVEKLVYRCSGSVLYAIRSMINVQAVNPLETTMFRDRGGANFVWLGKER